jgi:hypothetical protein
LRDRFFIIPGAVSLVVYVVVVVVLRTLTDQEKSMIWRVRSKLPGRRTG